MTGGGSRCWAGDEITSDSEDSSVIDEEAKDILLAFDWVGIGILSAYVLLMFVANMVDNHRKGLKCVCVRLAIVVRNQARQAVLHKRLSVTVTMGVDDLSGECREVFEVCLDLVVSGRRVNVDVAMGIESALSMQTEHAA